MQRLYTGNFPPDETVNFRKGAGRRFPIIARIAYGEIVEGKVHDSTWHFVSYKGQAGYIMSRYLTQNPPQNTKDDFMPVLVDTATNGNGSRLNIRENPGKNAKIITRVANGTALWARKELEGWHEVSFQGKQGYGMAKFLKPAEEKAESSTKPPPKVAYPFSRERAVLYALNHSDNSPSPHPCQNRNLSFASTDGKNDCADFVHQCLVAGGAPMFDGWHYPLKGIPTHWKNSGWAWTNRGRLALLQKDWIEAVACEQVAPGDIIYTYNQSATPTSYTHVTIAVSKAQKEGNQIYCTVCGNTTNQHKAIKYLAPNNCRCYRVKETLLGDGSEIPILLPEKGSGAKILSIQPI